MTTDEKIDFWLADWPDALIRAVAAQEPGLFRTDDPYAIRDEDMVVYAREIAGITLDDFDRDDTRYADIEAYAEVLKADWFRRFDVDGQIWWVKREEDVATDTTVALPLEFVSLSREEWPDRLIRAVGAQQPKLLRTLYGDLWAVYENDFPTCALVWLFEGGPCDEKLYRLIDLERFTADLKAEFAEILDETGETWWARIDVNSHDDAREAPERIEPIDPLRGLRLTEWPDSLITEVAAELPAAFRTGEYEAVHAFPDAQINAALAQWAEGEDDRVAAAGGLDAWIEQLKTNHFRCTSGDWWVFLEDWQQAEAESLGESKTAPSCFEGE